jgi:hypothetical protein
MQFAYSPFKDYRSGGNTEENHIHTSDELNSGKYLGGGENEQSYPSVGCPILSLIQGINGENPEKNSRFKDLIIPAGLVMHNQLMSHNASKTELSGGETKKKLKIFTTNDYTMKPMNPEDFERLFNSVSTTHAKNKNKDDKAPRTTRSSHPKISGGLKTKKHRK